MKTQPMSHQLIARERLRANPEYFSLGAEQGTGKTWMALDDTEFHWLAGDIEALVVVAPKGAHANWILREIPKHLEIPCRGIDWQSGAGVKKTRQINAMLKPDPGKLAVFAVNVDAVNVKRCRDFLRRFLRTYKTMMVVDESHHIKNSQAAARSKHVIDLGLLAEIRRIASGTLVADNPLDLFGQYEFLRSGLLGTTSYRAFVAEYAELLPQNSKIVGDIKKRNPYASPQVVRTRPDGTPIYKNLDKLRGLLAPITYRVLKSDCLDLPAKIYQTHYFDMTAPQRRLYEQTKKTLRYERADGELDIFNALTLVGKLRQITSGFINVEGEPTGLENASSRLSALKTALEDSTLPTIVWATYREEVANIVAALKHLRVVEYHGGISSADREQAVDQFQAGEYDVFVATPAAAGEALTLTAAKSVIYYSCDYSLKQRVQSEDRCHRVGTTTNIIYTDLVARDSIDERIATALQNKAKVAAEILDGI